MIRDMSNSFDRLRHGLLMILLILAGTACAGIDTVQFTSEVFPPKDSARDVVILDEKPSEPHIRIAQLTIADSKKKNFQIQRKIREKAADMGADAVVFGDPKSYYDHSVRYAPVYRPYGYYSSYYGWYGGGYATAVPVKNKVRRNNLTGTAIKYIEGTGQ